ncbi:hypothetical protein BIV57_05005 [Mangrovactinospora gilvigrisea]|uniref:Uncharacterized protein n=1 Tax=Mangrovactinospora gilvigrisea TaxID=1428644 RepID=A0A1J7BJ52_9ACTN|nr:hypothetical protein [Mangrovactinospora gilvigrisea]OIV38613.1 hypothetical protein BIV57_05005 [Mangrovactinospora gilvigrisea]
MTGWGGAVAGEAAAEVVLAAPAAYAGALLERLAPELTPDVPAQLAEVVAAEGGPGLVLAAADAHSLTDRQRDRLFTRIERLDDDRRGTALAALYRSTRDPALLHRMAASPSAGALVEALLARGAIVNALIRPLAGHPEIDARLVRRRDDTLTAGEFARAALRLGPPPEVDATVDELRALAESDRTPEGLLALVDEHLADSDHLAFGVRLLERDATPPDWDAHLDRHARAPLPVRLRLLLLHRHDCPPAVARALLADGDGGASLGPSGRRRLPEVAALVLDRGLLGADEVLAAARPVRRLMRLLEPGSPRRDRNAAARREAVRAALAKAVAGVSPERLRAAARLAPAFDGTLPELLDAAGARHPADAPAPAALAFLALLLEGADADVCAAATAAVGSPLLERLVTARRRVPAPAPRPGGTPPRRALPCLTALRTGDDTAAREAFRVRADALLRTPDAWAVAARLLPGFDDTLDAWLAVSAAVVRPQRSPDRT